jgi:hypothetical protein
MMNQWICFFLFFFRENHADITDIEKDAEIANSHLDSMFVLLLPEAS